MSPDPLSSLAEAARLLPAVPSARVLAAIWSLEGERSAFRVLKKTSLRLASIRDAFDAMSLINEVLDEALRLVGAERGVLVVLEEEKLNVVVSRMREGGDASGHQVRVPHSLLERVISSGKAIVTTNVQEDPKYTPTASIEALSIRSVLAVPLSVRDRVIGALYVDTQLTQRTFSDADASMLATFAAQAGTAVTLARSIRAEHDQYVGLVKTMLNTLDARDPYTAGHSERVGEYTRRLAQALGWTETEQERALFAGWVHDIGKIGIRDHYLYKEGRLTPEERRTVREHSVIGERILQTATRGFEEILPAVRNHHERWDGQGYPDGLSGENIPLLARMVGLADAFDAMTSSRPYAERRSWPEAFKVLQHEAGHQFDPALAPVFVELLELDAETISYDFTDLEPRDPTVTLEAERDDWSKRTLIDEHPAPIVTPPEPPKLIRVHRDPELEGEPMLEIESA